MPGIIDMRRQMALHYIHIPGLEKMALGKRLADRFKVNVFLENNIRSMALAELWFGQGRGLDNFVCIGIRTGIGAGVIVQRRLLHGKNNLAGEIGDWLCPVAPIQACSSGSDRSRGWSCDKLLPLEEIASVPAVLEAVRIAVEKDPRSVL